ncbi:HD domain-containing protein [Rhizobium helianthi]|uniref:HD domain-containing protein n=1 Tax=Rhizobium helianthi TaxID=1132695 RepID=A0ABW4M6W5_9HYPH
MNRAEIKAFAPHENLAAELLPHAFSGNDGAHDLAHIARVFRNAMRLQAKEGGEAEIVAAAALLHDCVNVEKNSPLRQEASRMAARKAAALLASLDWSEENIRCVAHAIEAHSFSAGIEPRTIEAKILQDADRLDAIGMIGAARCFYVAGRMSSQIYDPLDPTAATRSLNDKAFALDHFPAKLFKLADGFQTQAGRQLARERQDRLKLVYDLLLDEIRDQ